MGQSPFRFQNKNLNSILQISRFLEHTHNILLQTAQKNSPAFQRVLVKAHGRHTETVLLRTLESAPFCFVSQNIFSLVPVLLQLSICILSIIFYKLFLIFYELYHKQLFSSKTDKMLFLHPAPHPSGKAALLRVIFRENLMVNLLAITFY